jgi:DNA adenine methylase
MLAASFGSPPQHLPSCFGGEGASSRANGSQHGERATLPADQIDRLIAPAAHCEGDRKWILNPMKRPFNATRPVAPYMGGKRNLAAQICAIIDAHPHKSYAEPFVGMGGVFLRRQSQPKAEFINDAGRDVYNLFRMIQEHYVAFLDLMRHQITTQANFLRLRETDPETLTDLQRAARFLYIQRTSFGGRVRNPTFGFANERPARFNITTLEDDIAALHERLAGVTVTCMDFEEFIRRTDRPGALFYLDPPYWGCEGDYGPDVFQRGDFDRLAATLLTLKGDFLLSLNDVPEVRELFAWAELKPVDVTYSVSRARPTKAGELLISNFKTREGT